MGSMLVSLENFAFVSVFILLTVRAEVDDAVAEARQDGTGGRGANGFISSALAEEHKKDDVRST